MLAAVASLDFSNDHNVKDNLGKMKCLGSLIDKLHFVDKETDAGKVVFNPDIGADVTLIDSSTYLRLRPKPPL